MLAANFMWGLISPAAKYIFLASSITPRMLVEMRFLGATFLLWLASFFFPKEHVTHQDMLKMFFGCLLGVMLNQGLFTFGVNITSPIDASVITTSTPIFTMIIAALYLKEPITSKKVMGVFIGAMGALLLILSNASLDDTTRSSNIWGDITCILAELSFACYLVFCKDLIARYSPITLMKWMFTYASICVVPFSYSDLATYDWGGMSIELLLAVGFTVVCATFLCYLLVPVGQKNLRPTVVSMYCYVQPIVASCIVAVYWGTSSFTFPKMIAIVLVFTGVFLVTRSKSRAEMEAYQKEQKDA